MATTPTTLVSKVIPKVTSGVTIPANQVSYNLYDIIDAEDTSGKKIKVRRLREIVTLEQLKARKTSNESELARIDNAIAKINALP